MLFQWPLWGFIYFFTESVQINLSVLLTVLLWMQVEGGFMQGLGLFTLEELHYSPQGVLLTRGPGSYKIPAFGNVPTELSVSLLRDAPNDKAIFSSKVTRW